MRAVDYLRDLRDEQQRQLALTEMLINEAEEMEEIEAERRWNGTSRSTEDTDTAQTPIS